MVQGLQQAVDAFTAAAVSLPWALTDSFMSMREGFESARPCGNIHRNPEQQQMGTLTEFVHHAGAAAGGGCLHSGRRLAALGADGQLHVHAGGTRGAGRGRAGAPG